MWTSRLGLKVMAAVWMVFGCFAGTLEWSNYSPHLLAGGLGAVGLTFVVSWYGREIAEENRSHVYHLAAIGAFVTGLPAAWFIQRELS